MIMPKIYNLNHFVFLFSCFFIAQCCASENDPLIFKTKTCYQIDNYHDLNEPEFQKATTPDFFAAKKQLNENQFDAIAVLNKLACQGHTHSAIELGNICFEKENFEQAVKWCVFAFQFMWISNGKNNDVLVQKLSGLENKNSQYKGISAFLNLHTKDVKKSLVNLKQKYRNKTIECYLNQEERDQKIKFIEAILIQKFCSPDEQWNLMGQYYQAHKYEEAAAILKYLKTPVALSNLGKLYEGGHIGCKDGQPNYNEAAKCFKASNTPDALNDLGSMYAKGQIGSENGQPNYAEAAKHYRESNLPEALTSLGVLYMGGCIGCKDGQPNIAEAWQLLETAGQPISLHCQILIIEEYPHIIKDLLKVDNLSDTLQKVCKQLEEKNQNNPPDKRELYQGIISAYRDMNYDQALIHFQNALLLGCKDNFVMDLIGKVWVQSKLQNLYQQLTGGKTDRSDAEMQSQEMIPELSPGNSDAEVKSPEMAPEPSPVTIANTPERANELEKEIAEEKSVVSRPQKYKPVKSLLSKKEKYLQNLAKINQKIRASCGRIKDKSTQVPQVQKPLEVQFVNSEVESDYKTAALSSEKIIELMSDIESKPHGTEGAGKPEVLKGKCSGHKGCISRRLNHEDRLVYKVTGPGQILILSCKGHY